MKYLIRQIKQLTNNSSRLQQVAMDWKAFIGVIFTLSLYFNFAYASSFSYNYGYNDGIMESSSSKAQLDYNEQSDGATTQNGPSPMYTLRQPSKPIPDNLMQSAYVYSAHLPLHMEPEADKVVNAVKQATTVSLSSGNMKTQQQPFLFNGYGSEDIEEESNQKIAPR